MVTSSVTLNAVDYELGSRMRLFTRLQKISDIDEWRLLSVESSYVRDRLVAVVPGSNASSPFIMPEEAQSYPKSYRSLAMVMMSRGLKPRPTLPHEDDPQSVRQIQERNVNFLDGVDVGYGGA